MIWQLRVWVTLAKDSVNKTIWIIKSEFKKAGWDIEKALWTKAIKNLKKDAEKTTKTLWGLNSKLTELKTKLNMTAIWSKHFKKLQWEIKKTQKQIDKATNKVGIFGKALGSLKWLLAITWIYQLWKSIITLWSNLEQARVSFTTMLWSGKKAEKMLKDLTLFAQKTPFEITGLRQTTKQLLAFGIEQEKMIPTLKALWDVASGLSVPIEQVAYAYGQVRSANQLYGTELRQFMNAWVPILQELANMYWVTESAAKKMVENGLVWFNDVEEAFRRMSSEWWRFADLMYKQSDTLKGQWSNFLDQMTAIWEKIGTAIAPFLKWLISLMSKLVSVIVIWFTKAKKYFDKTAKYVQKNWEKLLKIFVSSFIAVLIFMKRKTVLEFMKWTVFYLLKWLKLLSLSTKLFSKDIWLNTKAIIVNSLVKWKNAIASRKMSLANLFTRKTFLSLGKWIWSVIKKVITLWMRFFAIAWIIVLVVTAIYKNWDKLKQKLAPLFEFLARAGQAAPDIIAWAWWILMDVIWWAVKIALWSAKKIVQALNYIPGVEIDTAWIDNAVKAVDWFTNKMKFTGKDVSATFGAISSTVSDVAWDFMDLWGSAWGLWWNLKDMWDDWEGAGKKISEANKKIQKSIKDVEKENNSLKNKVEKLQEKEEKRAEALLQFNQDIINSTREVKKEIENLWVELEKNLKTIDNDEKNSLADRYVEIKEREAEIEKEISKIKSESDKNKEKKKEDLVKLDKQIEIQKQKISEITEKTKESTKKSLKNRLEELKKQKETLENWKLNLEQIQKLNELRKENLRILSEKKKIQNSVDQKKLDDAERFSKLSKAEQIQEEAKIKKQEAEEEYRIEKEKLDKKLQINEIFRQINSKDLKLTQEDLNKFMQEKQFLAWDLETQRYFQKLAEEKIEHTRQKEAIIKMQKEIADETIALQDRVNSILKHNISWLKDEYRDLIHQIERAITRQRRLNSLKRHSSSSWSYAEWWYTGDGGKYEEAWIVHKWEYVVPQKVLKAIPNLRTALENVRTWNTTTQHFDNTKRVDVGSITVQDKIDLDLFFDNLKWKL